ncbi:hypothetical protein U1Q18_018453 [Sarracenia purpurea var. burkii]
MAIIFLCKQLPNFVGTDDCFYNGSIGDTYFLDVGWGTQHYWALGFLDRLKKEDEERTHPSPDHNDNIQVLPNDVDLLNPPADLEKRKHKLKRLVQSPNSFFMDVKCQGCFNITTVFSHSQTVVVCGNCQTVLCQPTGGRARLTEGCSFRRKGD